MNKVLLFVYGTLMSNHRANGYLVGSKFLGKATTKVSRYVMESYNGHYPIVFLNGMYKIAGEIYEIPESLLLDLDFYEGCDNTPHALYKRDYFDFVLENGEEVKAYMYYQSENVNNFQLKYNVIEENGIYRWR